MQLDIAILKRALCKALDDHVSMHGANLLCVDRDYYWRIPDKQIFDMKSKPIEFDVGSLVEEVRDINNSVESGDLLDSVSLQHLAAILSWMSAKAGGSID